MNPFLIGWLLVSGALIEALRSPQGTEAQHNILDGLKTSKQDLDVKWKTLEKAERKLRESNQAN